MIELRGTTGVWSGELRYGDKGRAREAAAELEELGYAALWIPDVGGDLFEVVESLLSATSSATVATGILNLWMHTPEESAEVHARLTADHGDRLLYGIGVSHAMLIDMNEAGRYRKPLSAMATFLDGLDAAPVPVPRERRVLAALGPKMLQLAATRSGGVHPYNVTPEHTALAREAVGPEALVLPEQAVVLSDDAAEARELGRRHLAGYLGLPNNATTIRRLGFGDDDFADGGSDRMVDALVAWGDESAIRSSLDAHRAAGADHICIQVITDDKVDGFPLEQWRRLAPALNAGVT